MPSWFDSIINDALERPLNDVFAEESLFNGHSKCEATLYREVERTNQYGEVVLNDYEISSLNAETGTVKTGDKYLLCSGTFEVIDILFDDGIRTVSQVSKINV